MSKLIRTLVVAATLAAMNLAALAAVAQPKDGDISAQQEVSQGWNDYNQSTRVPPAELQAQRELADRQTYYNQATRMSPAELESWSQAGDATDTPTAPPAQAPAPARPAEPSGEPGWLVVSLGALAAAMTVVAGLAVLAARRAIRTARVRQAI